MYDAWEFRSWCYPFPFRNSSLYSDASCTTHLGEAAYDNDPYLSELPPRPAGNVMLSQGIRSDGGTGLYSTGQVYVGGLYMKGVNGSCTAAGASDGGQTLTTGPELPLSALVPMTTVIE